MTKLRPLIFLDFDDVLALNKEGGYGTYDVLDALREVQNRKAKVADFEHIWAVLFDQRADRFSIHKLAESNRMGARKMAQIVMALVPKSKLRMSEMPGRQSGIDNLAVVRAVSVDGIMSASAVNLNSCNLWRRDAGLSLLVGL